MKDKRKNKFSMNDLYHEYKENDPLSKQQTAADNKIEEYDLNLGSIKDYNSQVKIINPKYQNITPLSGYIVRVFLHEPEITEAGILIPHKQLVQIQTQNGQATYAEVETPFPYARKAVVISTPPLSSFLKAGDVVQLAANPVRTIATGKAQNASVSIPAAYTHPSYNLPTVPEDISNEHYGYLLVSLQDIIVKLNEE